MIWANFFHIYQPPRWPKKIITKVAKESYRPLLRILKRNPHLKITLNISGSLTEQLAFHNFKDIIADIQKLAIKKQIELVGTAQYHPILPLLPEAEIERQIELNTAVNKKFFGRAFQPRGFFPPEMCYSKKVAAAVKQMGFNWIILDEISAQGTLGAISFDTAYVAPKGSLQYIFRNRMVSDYLSFRSQLKKPNGLWRAVDQDKRSKKILITAMDGENLGHHRPGLDRLWERLVTHGNITTMTFSELLDQYTQEKKVSPQPASWSSREIELKRHNPYGLWRDPQNPIHQLQWKLLNATIKLVSGHKKNKNYPRARKQLDRQLASDQFWWASAKPWWSLDIITDKTNELLHTAALIDGTYNLKKIAHNIITLGQQWQQELTFQTIAKNYLAAEARDNIRFIAGKKITN